MVKAVLLNDTENWYHWGCTLTSIELKHLISAKYDLVASIPIKEIYALGSTPADLGKFDDEGFIERYFTENRALKDALERADAVFINGEGTLHGIRESIVHLLFIAYVAKRVLGKSVAIVNHSVYPESGLTLDNPQNLQLYRKVYEVIDHVAIREPASRRVMERLGIRSTESFDCSVFALEPDFAERANTVLIGGSASLPEQAIGAVTELIREIAANGFEVEILYGAKANPAAGESAFLRSLAETCGPGLRVRNCPTAEAFIAAIGGAGLLVSGRFHYSIAAYCLGTPFVMLESNTPKMAALADILQAPALLAWGGPAFVAAVVQAATRAKQAAFTPERAEAVAKLQALARNNVP